jgi:hypothetical protein
VTSITIRVTDHAPKESEVGRREPTGRWSLVSGRWSLVAGRWSLGAGHWSLVAGRWSLVAGTGVGKREPIGHWSRSLVTGHSYRSRKPKRGPPLPGAADADGALMGRSPMS